MIPSAWSSSFTASPIIIAGIVTSIVDMTVRISANVVTPLFLGTLRDGLATVVSRQFMFLQI
ncbi:MAG: hypothetical protein ACXACD_21770 [Candidatus Thorarchaeota archaeon]